jgi:hypothetical protein
MFNGVRICMIVASVWRFEPRSQNQKPITAVGPVIPDAAIVGQTDKAGSDRRPA